MASTYGNIGRPVIGSKLGNQLAGKPVRLRSGAQGGPILPGQPRPYTGGTTTARPGATGLGPRPIHSRFPAPPGTGPAVTRFGPTAPTAAQTAPSNSATTQTQQVPLDSEALNNIATHLFDVNNQIDGLNERRGYASTDLQSALAQLAYQEPRDQLHAEQAANSRGGLYSTVYNQQLGDLTKSYGTRQDAANQGYQRTVDALAAQIAALQGGIPLYNEGQAEGSATRAAALAAANPPADATAASTPSTPGASSPVGALAKRIAALPTAKANPKAKSPSSPGAQVFGFVRGRNGGYYRPGK